MDAKQKQGMAALEEFLQQKYVEHYDDIEGDENKVERLMSISTYSDYFYIPVKEGIGSLKYVVDGEGHALYLIKKANLPEEIKEGLVGGDAGEGTYNDYFNLNDVYGVTKNLKVYYCNNGLDSIEGLAKENLDNDNPLREVFDESVSNKYGILSKYDKDGDNKISAEEVKLITTLTLKDTSEFENLSQLVNFVNLTELTLDNVNLESLNGLRNCPKLTYISFENYGGDNKNTIKNYSEIKDSNKLQYVYLKASDDNQVNSVFNAMSGSDYPNLYYLGIMNSNSNENDMVTDISCLENLSKTTKEAVKYMYLYYNDISSIDSLLGYIGVRGLNVGYNRNLKSLAGVSGMESIIELNASGCNLGGDEEYNTEKENNGKNSLTDSIASLENKKKLKTVHLSENINLKWISYLAGNSVITTLFLDGDINIVSSDMAKMKDVYWRVSSESKKNFPSKYLSLFNSSELVDYKGYEKNLSNNDTEILALLNNTEVEYLRLDGNTNLGDDESSDYTLNEILSTCTNLKALSLGGLTKLKSIDFVENMPDLEVLDLVGCSGVSDLSLLERLTNESKLTLGTLRIDNSAIDLTKIQNVISSLSYPDIETTFNETQPEEGFIASKTLYEKLNKCENITKFRCNYRGYPNARVDLSNCSKLKSVGASHCKISFILPSSLESLSLQHYSTNVISDLSRCSNLSYIKLAELYKKYNLDGWLRAMENCQNLNYIEVSTYDMCKQLDFGVLENSSISKIKISSWNSFIPRWYKFNWSRKIKYFN